MWRPFTRRLGSVLDRFFRVWTDAEGVDDADGQWLKSRMIIVPGTGSVGGGQNLSCKKDIYIDIVV